MKNDVNETTEFWRDYRHEMQERRAKRLPGQQKEIEDLQPEFDVRMITEYQFRVNESVDLYPVRRRYHVLANGRRGRFKNPRGLLRDLIKSGDMKAKLPEPTEHRELPWD
jgi:hypothetical protein